VELRAILFDVNGTLIDIETDEGRDDVYRALGRFLGYQGIDVAWRELRDLYFATVRRQLERSPEPHPDADVPAAWAEILQSRASERKRALPAEQLRQLPLFLAQMQRALSRNRLQLFPDVRPVLDRLRAGYRLAIVSDHQDAFAMPELRAVGVADYFDPIVISSEHGIRKPDPRLFHRALDGISAATGEAVYVGNDLYHDVEGAHRAGLKCVLFSSGPRKHHPYSTLADYVIHHFGQLPEAIDYFRTRVR
jgi:putative hydrolase of the HAD superfamily